MASESNPVEQGEDFANSIGTLDREEISELTDISTESVATTRSATDDTMKHGMTEKTGTSFFQLTMGTSSGEEVENEEEEEDDDERDDFESQISLNSSIQENGASTNREICSSDQFGVLRTKHKTIDVSQQSREFVTTINSDVQSGKNRNTADYEETSSQIAKTRVSTSTKLLGTDRVTASTSDAISGQRDIDRRGLDQHSGHHRRRERTDVLKNE